MAHRWVDLQGWGLHCVEADAGPLGCCCMASPGSGTPGDARSGRPPTPDGGVPAPDLRGYNTSDKPPRVRDYRPRVLDQQAAHGLRLVGNHQRR
jgi:hypothetical protein